ncbi:MAG TPA: anti-sigma F factor antagonist [Clostridiales bacterium]|nr:anti-sigma F factor antagonist [Clostridiales bacterium]
MGIYRVEEAVDLLTDNKRKGDILIVGLSGELDHHHSAEVRDALDRLLDDPSIRHMILNLRHLHFMDSSGIGVFMGRYKTIHKRGGQFSIANINSQLARILEMSGLYRILKVYDTVEQAIDGIRGESE